MSSKTEELMKLDLYNIIGVTHEATDKEILKSYRKKALKCHPDKNPDNPKAAEEFHLLSRALEILTDAAAKTAYDNTLKARRAAELRKQHLNSKRKKLRQELEDRELAANQVRETEVDAAKNLEAQIERLRKEGSQLLEAEQERMREELKKTTLLDEAESSDRSEAEPEPARLRLKWKAKKNDVTNGGYDEKRLKELFQKYGEIGALLVSRKKNGSAVLEYESPVCALKAQQNETGMLDNPITITWLCGKPDILPEFDNEREPRIGQKNPGDGGATFPSTMPAFSFDPSKVPPQASVPSSNRDYEDLVLRRLRQAEERKRLLEQIQKDEEAT